MGKKSFSLATREGLARSVSFWKAQSDVFLWPATATVNRTAQIWWAPGTVKRRAEHEGRRSIRYSQPWHILGFMQVRKERCAENNICMLGCRDPC